MTKILTLIYVGASQNELRCAHDIFLSPSKSLAARTLLLASAEGITPKKVLTPAQLYCDDIEVMCAAADAAVEGVDAPFTLNIGHSGTAKRLLSAWFACIPGAEVTLRQSARLSERPLGTLPELLQAIGGGEIRDTPQGIHICGEAPLGSMQPMRVPGNVSSQIITALMLPAYAMPEGLTLHVEKPIVSAPYIEMTAAVLRQWGVKASFDEYRGIVRVLPGVLTRPDEISIEPDWSGASYLYEYVAFTGEPLLLRGLRLDSLQGDSRCAELFRHLGVSSRQWDEGVLVQRTRRPVARFEADMASTPDLVPAVAVTCAMLGIPFRITGVAHLRLKESDRLEALASNLRLYGIALQVGEDLLSLVTPIGPRQPQEPIPTYDDHRIAMAFGVTAARLGRISITEPRCVDKSFPGFWFKMPGMILQ